MDINQLLTEQSTNHHMLQRYVAFIRSRNDRTIADGTYVEHHHILPRSHYTEHSAAEWNLIRLTAREHFLAHWMLAKILGGKQWFAFNNMKRLAKQGHFTHSSLYEKSRKYVAEQVRKANTGLVRSDEVRRVMSEQRSTTLVVRRPDGTLRRVSCKHPKYLSGEYVPQLTGATHTENTKQKMRDAKKHIPPMHMCVTDAGDTIQVYSHDGCPVGTTPGVSESYRKSRSDAVSATRWYHDPTTGKDRRVKVGGDVTGLIPGRKGGLGFSHINKDRKRKGE